MSFVLGKPVGNWLLLRGDELVCKGRKSYWSGILEHWSIDLKGVTKIVACKRDLFTIDQVCFALQSSDGLWHTVTEDDPVWQALLEKLEQLPGFDLNWRDKVIQPPFVVNETVILEASGPSETSR
jgi:hypothetical protein